MQKTEDKIYSSIRGKGAGCVITNSDFTIWQQGVR